MLLLRRRSTWNIKINSEIGSTTKPNIIKVMPIELLKGEQKQQVNASGWLMAMVMFSTSFLLDSNSH